MKLGKLIGASLGPGDPGLISRASWQAITGQARWFYPIRKKGSDSYALSIALAAELELPADAQALIFPMTHDQQKLARYWNEAAQLVWETLSTGRDAVFLVEGDASTYSTFGHLARTLQQCYPAADVDIIPGVPAYTAACGTLQWPLADVDDTVAIVPAAYGIPYLEKLLEDFDTLVLLKIKPLLDDVIDFLDEKELLEHSAFIEKSGSADERIIMDVKSLRGTKVNYLSLLIVKNNRRIRGELIKGCRKK